MASQIELRKMLRVAASQAKAYEKSEQSREEINYGKVMHRSASALTFFIRTASFDQLLILEQAFQDNDLDIYAKVPSTLQAVKEGIDAFNEGFKDYKTLVENPTAYMERAVF